MKKKILLFLYFVSFQLLFVVSIFGQTLEMPQGFRVQIYAEIHSARQMALADNGVVFVGTENGKIYLILHENCLLKPLQKPPIIMPKRLLYSCLKIRLIEKGNSALRYCQNLGIKAGVLLDQSK